MCDDISTYTNTRIVAFPGISPLPEALMKLGQGQRRLFRPFRQLLQLGVRTYVLQVPKWFLQEYVRTRTS